MRGGGGNVSGSLSAPPHEAHQHRSNYSILIPDCKNFSKDHSNERSKNVKRFGVACVCVSLLPVPRPSPSGPGAMPRSPWTWSVVPGLLAVPVSRLPPPGGGDKLSVQVSLENGWALPPSRSGVCASPMLMISSSQVSTVEQCFMSLVPNLLSYTEPWIPSRRLVCAISFSVGVVVCSFFFVCGAAAPTAAHFHGRACPPLWLLVWCVWSPHALTLKLLGTKVEQVNQVSGRVLFLYRALVPLAVFCFFECNECAVAMRPLHSGCVWLLPWACCDHAVFPGAFVVLAK